MTVSDIRRTIRDFGLAARNAREAGFDGIEIHAAHGYLADQFFWTGTNARKDGYGGDLAARCRFAAEIVMECRAQTGADFAITLRLSQWKQLDYLARVVESPEELADWLAPLSAAGVDGYHVSTRRFWEPAFPGDDETLSGWVRRLGRRPVIAVGSALLDVDFKAATGKVHADLTPGGPERVLDGLARGRFDMIAIGRALLANPDLANRLVSGQIDDLVPFDRAHLDQLT